MSECFTRPVRGIQSFDSVRRKLAPGTCWNTIAGFGLQARRKRGRVVGAVGVDVRPEHGIDPYRGTRHAGVLEYRRDSLDGVLIDADIHTVRRHVDPDVSQPALGCQRLGHAVANAAQLEEIEVGGLYPDWWIRTRTAARSTVALCQVFRHHRTSRRCARRVLEPDDQVAVRVKREPAEPAHRQRHARREGFGVSDRSHLRVDGGDVRECQEPR